VLGARLTLSAAADILNLMRRLIFCAYVAAGAASRLQAQQVPGRDLLRFPLGIGAASPALGEEAGAELWNPAAGDAPGKARFVFGASALDTPQELGVSAQLLSGRVRLDRAGSLAAHLSVARAAVDGLVRTETDPQSVADDVPYGTLLFSLGAASQRGRHLALGTALRYRTGRADGVRRSALSLDVGAVADSLLGGRVRVGASTFLWRPGSPRGEGATYIAGADARAWRRARLAELRLGYAATASSGAPLEHYALATLRSHGVDATAGVLRTQSYGHANVRPRLGVGLHYARYVVGIAREESGAGLGPTYQFMLSTSVQ
jgi:hypothetical protein